MSTKYSVFNTVLLDKVTSAIKLKRPYMNVQPLQIHIKSNHKYIDTIASFDKEQALLEEVDFFIAHTLSEEYEIHHEESPQEKQPLSQKAKEFLEQIDSIMAQEYKPVPKENISSSLPLLNDAPLLKKTFEHLDKTYKEKYSKIIDSNQ